MNELESLMVLNAVMGLGNIRIRRLLEVFGSARKVLSLSLGELLGENIIPAKVAQNLAKFPKDIYIEKELGLVAKNKVKVVSVFDREYPENLKEIPDAPVLLYLKGSLPERNHLAVAIVGSRKASIYGLAMAEKFANGLSELGLTIVSGLARGIDSAAHQGALKAQGPTIAVMGCGLSHIYPSENKKLFSDIAATGCVISEFSMDTRPIAHNFPRRNRIISGLSLGVIVVEATMKSGALITSDFALEQGREVFAVPGKADSPNAQGSHHLIKQGAKLAGTIEDILEELKPRIQEVLGETKKNVMNNRLKIKSFKLDEHETSIMNKLPDEPFHIDVLVQDQGISVSDLLSILLQLELKGMVKQLPGKMFVKCAAMGSFNY